jgi:hypothetical protein
MISITEALRHPERAASRLVDEKLVFGLRDVKVVGADPQAAVFELVLDPWAPMAAEGYPREVLAVLINRSGDAYAMPRGDAGRHWKHRFPDMVLRECTPPCLGQLCLYYPDDPREFRWEASDGLEAFVTMAHRHLMAEEYWRRSGERCWPAPDAPHRRSSKP